MFYARGLDSRLGFVDTGFDLWLLERFNEPRDDGLMMQLMPLECLGMLRGGLPTA